MKKIMVDMDDVIVEGGFLYLLNQYLNTNYKEEDFKDFYMQDIVPDKEAFFNYFFEHNLYEHCHLMKDAYEVLKALNEKYEVYVCTSYIFKEYPRRCGKILEQKFAYLSKELPFLDPYKFVFVCDKSILDFEIRIDDRIDNLKNAKQKILFTAYHNKDVSEEELKKENITRALDWLDVKKLLLK